MVFCHVKLLCRADTEQKGTPVSPLPCTLHVGPSERTPIPLEVNKRPTWPAFDQCEKEYPAAYNLGRGAGGGREGRLANNWW